MRRFFAALALVVTCWAAAPAQAGVYTDDLSKCLVKSATPDDQKNLILWIFTAMSSHPAVKAYSNIADSQRDAFNKQAGALMQRLLTVDCRTETVASLKYEGSQAIPAAFGILGQVAMRGLMSDPSVAKGVAGLTAGLDNAKLEALGKEAGLPEALGAKPQ
jgi:hypothetical protein